MPLTGFSLLRARIKALLFIHCRQKDPAIDEGEYFDKILNLAKVYE
jgi:hypothetical protein